MGAGRLTAAVTGRGTGRLPRGGSGRGAGRLRTGGSAAGAGRRSSRGSRLGAGRGRLGTGGSRVGTGRLTAAVTGTGTAPLRTGGSGRTGAGAGRRGSMGSARCDGAPLGRTLGSASCEPFAAGRRGDGKAVSGLKDGRRGVGIGCSGAAGAGRTGGFAARLDVGADGGGPSGRGRPASAPFPGRPAEVPGPGATGGAPCRYGRTEESPVQAAADRAAQEAGFRGLAAPAKGTRSRPERPGLRAGGGATFGGRPSNTRGCEPVALASADRAWAEARLACLSRPHPVVCSPNSNPAPRTIRRLPVDNARFGRPASHVPAPVGAHSTDFLNAAQRRNGRSSYPPAP